MKILLSVVVASLFTGCAVSSASDRSYERETAAHVVARIEYAKLRQLKGLPGNARSASLVPIVGANKAPAVEQALDALFTRTSLGEMLGMTSTVTVYAYVVRTDDGRDVTVLSEYPSFDEGRCVMLFESSKPDYPKIGGRATCKVN